MVGLVDRGGIKIQYQLKTANGETSTLVGTVEVVAGEWTHVAATYDGAAMRLYVNGQASGSLPRTGSIAQNAMVPAALGATPQGDRRFDGLIDEVRLYTMVLSPGEIEAAMNAPAGATRFWCQVSGQSCGSITPSGERFLAAGQSTFFYLTADSGYEADAIDIAGVSRDASGFIHPDPSGSVRIGGVRGEPPTYWEYTAAEPCAHSITITAVFRPVQNALAPIVKIISPSDGSLVKTGSDSTVTIDFITDNNTAARRLYRNGRLLPDSAIPLDATTWRYRIGRARGGRQRIRRIPA